MVELSCGEMHRIAPLFAFTKETMVLSVLQGHMGQGWADSRENPTCARTLTGDFMCLAGDSGGDAAREMVRHVPEGRDRPFFLAIYEHEGWSDLLKATWPPERITHITRYAIKKEPDVFDRQKLQGFVDGLAEGYTIAPIDELIYPRTFSLPFEGDFCTNFASSEDYLRKGIGFVVLRDGEIVGGASSFSVYDDGIEIEIATHPDHRRRGLATAVGAKLILACLDRGLYPSWDAANLESVALSEKLGYHLDHPYGCYVVRWAGEDGKHALDG